MRGNCVRATLYADQISHFTRSRVCELGHAALSRDEWLFRSFGPAALAIQPPGSATHSQDLCKSDSHNDQAAPASLAARQRPPQSEFSAPTAFEMPAYYARHLPFRA